MLNGKTAIVTGAGHPQGIGAAIAREFSAQGARVAITDLGREQENIQKLVSEIQNKGGEALAMSVDVTKGDQILDCVQRVVSRYGGIDILANNAGVGVGSSKFLEQTVENFQLTFGVNVLGLSCFAQAVIPSMKERGGGAIINTASLSGLRHIPAIPPWYTASKFAVIGITKAIAQEFGPDNIRCNAVCPGSIDTQMRSTAMTLMTEEFGITMEEAELEENATISLGRPAQPGEVASVVSFLAGPQGRYISGAAIPVDGGMIIGL